MLDVLPRPIADIVRATSAAPVNNAINADNPRYEDVVDKLVSPEATRAERDRAYEVIAGIEQRDSVCYTDEALTAKGAEALAADGTVPLNIAEVAPLVPPGTSLGPFDTADEAATAMMEYSNPLSIAANLENGGLVLRNPDNGKFYVTTPMGGTLDGFNPGAVPVPAGYEQVGAYHGHANYSLADGTATTKENDYYDSDHFSEQDKLVAEGGYYGDVIYVSTPSGDFRKYDSATNQDTKIN